MLFFVLISAVSAEAMDESVLGNASDEPVGELADASFNKVSQTDYLIGDSFEVTLVDGKNVGISNKTVHFQVRDKISDVLTDGQGVAKLKLNFTKNVYTIKYFFNESGYKPAQGSKQILLLSKPTSTVSGTNMNIYAGLKYCMKVTLKADGVPLQGRKVIFTVNKKSYTVRTDAKGVANFYINMYKGTYTIKYRFAGEDVIKPSSSSSRVKATIKKNPYGTKYMHVVIDADGGFTKAFLNDVAKKLRKCGWKVTVRGIGPGQHSKNYKKVYNAVYMPFYNGLCAATIKEMTAGYYGGLIKSHKSVLTPSWYTADWVSAKMSKFRNDITNFGYLKRAWDDNFSPSSFKGINDPAGYMTKNKIRYTVGDTTYKIVEQFVFGGWVAHH